MNQHLLGIALGFFCPIGVVVTLGIGISAICFSADAVERLGQGVSGVDVWTGIGLLVLVCVAIPIAVYLAHLVSPS